MYEYIICKRIILDRLYAINSLLFSGGSCYFRFSHSDNNALTVHFVIRLQNVLTGTIWYSSSNSWRTQVTLTTAHILVSDTYFILRKQHTVDHETRFNMKLQFALLCLNNLSGFHFRRKSAICLSSDLLTLFCLSTEVLSK